MDHLSENHWDDVVTSSTTLNRYNDILQENGFKDDDDDTGEPDALRDDETVSDHDASTEPVEEAADASADDDTAEAQLTDENREILSALTDNGAAAEEHVPAVSKDDNLFNNIDVGPIEVSVSESSHNASSSSPVKKRTTKIMYKPPRFRRSALKSKDEAKGSENDNKENSSDDAETGPLALNNADSETDAFEASAAGFSPLKRDKLISSVDKPLFELNSPKKDVKSAMPKTPTSSSVAHTPAPEQNKPEFTYSITVGDPHKIGSELLNAHIQYSVITKSNFPVFEKVAEVVVERRYNDFLWLYNQLVFSHPGLVVPPPPEKQAVGRFKKNFIENRRLSLEKMLASISQHPVLQKDQDFIVFLTSENFTSESKYREHSVELEEESGFMSSITGAFSSQPKYVEQDAYFIGQQQYIENLDLSLRNLYKSLELISSTRGELVISVEEFNKYLAKIAELEINNELAAVFGNYSELVAKIQDNIERFSMNEMLTIGNTIDEYIRTIGSVKIIFNQRNKLVMSLATNEANLEKKQKSLSKFKLKFHNQLEKIKKYETEISDLENFIGQERTKKADLVERIKGELAKFDNSRLTDFKASFEIYWESLIESQKELIELWETFYDSCKF